MADRNRWQRGRPWGGSERPDIDAKVTYLPAVPNHLFFCKAPAILRVGIDQICGPKPRRRVEMLRDGQGATEVEQVGQHPAGY
jgi:hypothetical protein